MSTNNVNSNFDSGYTYGGYNDQHQYGGYPQQQQQYGGYPAQPPQQPGYTVASYTNSGAHDLKFGMGLLNWVEQICLQ